MRVLGLVQGYLCLELAGTSGRYHPPSVVELILGVLRNSFSIAEDILLRLVR